MKTTTKDILTDEELEPTVDNAYKHRWIWYHTILAIEILLVNFVLIAILVVLALK